MKKTVYSLLFLVIFLFPANSHAMDLESRLGIGISSSGVSMKIGLSSDIGLEARFISLDGITAAGPRLYWYLNPSPKDNLLVYTGLEADYIGFDDSGNGGIKGSGASASAFLGLELFASSGISAAVDIGPAVFLLTEEGGGVSNTGYEFIFNAGINIYF